MTLGGLLSAVILQKSKNPNIGDQKIVIRITASPDEQPSKEITLRKRQRPLQINPRLQI